MTTSGRTHNSIRNSVWGVVSSFVNLFGQFMVRTVVIYVLGNQYIGLDNFFISTLKILNFADLGIASAISYSMYDAVSKNDLSQIGAIAKFYKKLNLKVGLFITFIGIIFSFALRFFALNIDDNSINIYFLYYLYLINSVIGYFMYSYEIAIMEAFQRNDLQSKVMVFSKSILFCTQILVILLSQKYLLYVIAIPIVTIAENLFRHQMFSKEFDNIELEGVLNDDIKIDIKKKLIALFGHRINGVCINSADTIVLTAFIGLELTGIYSNYFYIFSAITMVAGIFFSATRSSIGNSYILQSKEKNYTLFLNISFLTMWLAAWSSICYLCLIQPFMFFWVGNDGLLEISSCIWMSAMIYENIVINCIFNFKDAAGLWWEDKFRPYIVCIANLVINIVLVQRWGVNGVIASTVCTRVLISFPWALHILYSKVFNKQINKFILTYITWAIVLSIISCLTYRLCMITSNDLLGFIAKGGICLIFPNAILIFINRKREEFIFWVNWLKGRVNRYGAKRKI